MLSWPFFFFISSSSNDYFENVASLCFSFQNFLDGEAGKESEEVREEESSISPSAEKEK